MGNGNSSGANTTWRIGWLNTADTFAGTIADGTGTTVVKVGSGTWTLSGNNSATNTLVSTGVLSVSGSFSGANIRVASGAFLDVSPITTLFLSSGQTLGGNGTVWGSVDTSGGGAIAPGFSIDTLTVTNAVTLGGNAVMEVNRSGFVSDKLVAPSITYGGTLTIKNVGATLQVGDAFDLFDGVTSGTFSTISGGYYTWSGPTASGVVTVTAILPHPTLSVTSTATDITLNATAGLPGGALSVVTSTNISAPLDTWTTVQNDVFDGSGNYTITIAIDQATPQRLYAIRAF